MRNSLENAVEEFFVKLFKADSRLSGKSIVHSDREGKAGSNAIVVTAKQGNHNLAGFGGFDVEVGIEYRSPGGTKKASNDLVAAAMQDIVYNSTLSPIARKAMATAAGLADLLIKDESTSDRQNSQDLRKRMLTFPLQARLA